MKDQRPQTEPICRPATSDDMWTYFERVGESRILKVENKPETVYFQNNQIVEVHRNVTREYSKWFGLIKWSESIIEIEEGFYFCPYGKNAEEEYFYFLYHEEKIRLAKLPDDTLFIPTDNFIKFGEAGKREKKKSLFARLFPSFEPQPTFVPV